jgi:TolB protein
MDALDPSWTPDGRHLVYGASPAGSGTDYGLYQLELETGQVTRIGDLSGELGTFWQVDVSPDGTQLVTQVVDAHSDVYVVDLETGVATIVVGSPQDESEASWAPDGRSILFDRDDSAVIATVADDGSWTERTVSAAMPLGGATWAPDGGAILGTAVHDVVYWVDVSDGETGATAIQVEGARGAEVDWQRTSE